MSDIIIEQELVKVGQAITKQLVVNWFKDKKGDSRRGKELHQLVRSRFPIPRKERDILTSLWQIEDDIAKRLAPAWSRTAKELPENEQRAALDAVADTLESADLTNGALFQANLDPLTLAEEIRRKDPMATQRSGLSVQAIDLYNITLDRACISLLHLVCELPEFDSNTAIESLRRLTFTLTKLDEILIRLPATTLDSPNGTSHDETFLARYLDLAARTYDRLEVIGLTTHTYDPRTTLSVGYLSLTVRDESTERQRRSTSSKTNLNWLQKVSDSDPPSKNLRAEAALGNSRRTMIRGEAGAGKSTLLRWLAINSAHKAFKQDLAEWNACVPIIVKLREFSDRQLPRGDELLTQPSSPQCGPIPTGWVHRQLTAGRVLLLVDGVDELAQRQREAVKNWLRSIFDSYPDVRVVVTTRPAAVTPTWLAREEFRTIELEPMSPSDVKEFLRRWHRALLDSATSADMLPCAPEQVIEHERTLFAQLQARAHLRALARSPLLCAMLCALNLDRKGQLPRERKALYAAAFDMLLERRDSQRSIVSADAIHAARAEKQEILQALAWWLNENNRSEMNHSQAILRIRDRLKGMPNVHDNAEALLSHLLDRSGVIRRPALDRIDFVHRTFQEYLAAKEAVNRDSIDLLVRNARSDLWRETILMACAHANPEQRGRLLTGVLDSAKKVNKKASRQLHLLAAACLETAVNIEPASVIDQVKSCLQDIIPPRSVRESRSLATVGESLLDNLPAELQQLTAAKAAACIRTAALINGPKSLDVIKRYARDERASSQQELIDSWRYFDSRTYAQKVLANAALVNGTMTLYDVEFIQNTDELTLLRELEADLGNITSLNFLPNNDNLVKLRANSDDTLDLSPLRSHKEVRELTLHAKRFQQIDSIKNLKHLQWLVLYQADPLSSLRFVPEAPLEVLSLSNLSKVTDYGTISDLEHLKMLHLIGCNKLRNFEILRDRPNLEALSLDDCQAVELASRVAEVAPHVTKLWLERTPIQDIEPLSSMSLTMLNLPSCPIKSLTPLTRTKSLVSLNLNQCPNLLELEPLTELPMLQRLYLTHAAHGFDLTPLKESKVVIHVATGQDIRGIDSIDPDRLVYFT